MITENASISLTRPILAADDDPIFRSLVTARLRTMGTRVVEAESGMDAWQAAATNDFALAVVDLEMPGIDGMTLIQCLRSHPRTKHIPIVVCTSRENTKAMQDAIAAGASSYLTKPLNWSMFEAHMRHLLHMSADADRAGARIAALEAAFARLVDELEPKLARALEATARAAGRSVVIEELTAARMALASGAASMLASRRGVLRDSLADPQGTLAVP
ncbi:MAG: response regulator [Hyphomicrobiaceae bacterium]|nr:response regulator [Hyphomicrobiaceae bacterium]